MNFLLLINAPLLVLFSRLLLNVKVTHAILVHFLQFFLLASIVLKSIPLTHGLLCQLLILGVDVALNLLHITLGVDVGSLLVVLELLLQLCFLFLCHLGHLDVNAVLFLFDGPLDRLAVLLDEEQL